MKIEGLKVKEPRKSTSLEEIAEAAMEGELVTLEESEEPPKDEIPPLQVPKPFQKLMLRKINKLNQILMEGERQFNLAQEANAELREYADAIAEEAGREGSFYPINQGVLVPIEAARKLGKTIPGKFLEEKPSESTNK